MSSPGTRILLAEDDTARRLDSLEGSDYEKIHSEADEAILEFLNKVHPVVYTAYRRVQDRTKGWHMA